MSVDVQEQFSQASDIVLRYESPFEWQERLVSFSHVEDAEYPPLVEVKSRAGVMCFLEYDMLIQEDGRPPLLFSGAHNRLLYEMIEENFLFQNPNRVLVLVDDHDDFFLGKGEVCDNRNIHTGNWGAAGVIQQQWNEVIHLSRNYSRKHDLIQIRNTAIPLGQIEKHFEITEVDLVNFEEAFPLLIQHLKGKNIIYSHDADEFTDWRPEYTDSVRLLMREFFKLPLVDLIHFTPSPAYCSPEEAIPQWNLLREVYGNV